MIGVFHGRSPRRAEVKTLRRQGALWGLREPGRAARSGHGGEWEQQRQRERRFVARLLDHRAVRSKQWGMGRQRGMRGGLCHALLGRPRRPGRCGQDG